MSDIRPTVSVCGFHTRVAIAFVLVLTLGLLAASSASASFGQVGTFSEASLGAPTYSAASVAINVTGVGGVQPGTVYVVSGLSKVGVSVYGPKGEPIDQWGDFSGFGIAVDQSTGYVYVEEAVGAGSMSVQVYSADGSRLITSFGEVVPAKEEMTKSPEEIHGQASSGIAVNNAGAVYIEDNTTTTRFESRIMVFEPQAPGDYEHYVYAGRSKDIAYSTSEDQVNYAAQAVSVDDAGNVYMAAGGELEHIYEFSPNEPGTPVCSYKVPGGGEQGMTVNPQTGEVFFYTEKHKNTIFQLSGCNGSKEFVQKETLTITPVASGHQNMFALAFDPLLVYGPSRSAGVLYGVAATGLGYILAPAEVHSPAIEAESVSSVVSSGAALSAVVNPNGWQTHYVFQYIDAAAYQANDPSDRFAGALEAPVGGATLAGGKSPVGVGDSVSGLSADTEYHYRIVAQSHCNPSEETEVCEAIGETGLFRTYPVEASGLPDGRAYELVSPVAKNGGQVLPLQPETATCGIECEPGGFVASSPKQSSVDGEAIVYQGDPFSPGAGRVTEDEYISKRTGSGWQTTVLSPALQSYQAQYGGFDSSLSRDVLLQGTSAVLGEGAPEGYPDIYSQLTGDPAVFSPLLTRQPPDRLEAALQLEFAGASSDFSHLFFAANDVLTEETPVAPAAVDGGVEKMNLYESVDGQLQLVNVLPGNTKTVPGATFGSEARAVNRQENDFSHAISEDGSRVFWSDQAGHVYVRESGVETVSISQSQRSSEDSAGPRPARFLTASADGSRALLASSQELTDNADTGSVQQRMTIAQASSGGTFTISCEGQMTSPIAYDATAAQIQAALESLSSLGSGKVEISDPPGGMAGVFVVVLPHSEALLTVDGSGLTGAGAGIEISYSRPGTALYEWHEGSLTAVNAGHGVDGFEGIVGQSEDLSHLYFVDTAVLGEQPNEQGGVAKAGEDNLYAWDEGAVAFVASLVPEDSHQEPGGQQDSDWFAAPQWRSAEASPDGRWVAFQSSRSLTGYDNTGPCKFDSSKQDYVSGPCHEVFLFDSSTGKLVCASCDPTGAPPLGRSNLSVARAPLASFSQPRYLSNSGRLFFNSEDSLTLADTNAGVIDVYEYEPEGVGSCVREAGCVGLISGGRGSSDSAFLSADATGKNVFFTTRDKLVMVDHDELFDLYDAREGGGLASQSEVSQSGECHGEACQPSVGGVNDPVVSSLSFEGTGDVLSAPAPVVTKVKAKMPTRQQLLVKALHECRKKPKHKRAACEKTARKKFAGKAGKSSDRTSGVARQGGR